MRFAPAAPICAAALLAILAPAARADDSAIPGMNRHTATFGRSMSENPAMRPFMNRSAPAPQAAAPAPAQAAAPAPAAMPAAVPTRLNVLRDADALIQRAEAEIRARDMHGAAADLDQAEMALRNARAAGDAVPAQAIAPLDQARAALHHGQAARSEREAEAARQIIASAE